jgi:hypothetical protein
LKTQRQSFRNDSTEEIEVYVEMWPQRYLLKPCDEMVVEAEVPSHGQEVFGVVVTNDGLQIYPNIGVPEQVWINGSRAEETGKARHRSAAIRANLGELPSR